MALIGGLILNLMPCVLPVLGMKLGSILLVEEKSRSHIRRQFLASVAGIIASFMALAAFMTLLRLSNHALAWGVQFQNAWFIGFMALVMLLFSASLFGLFEFRLPSSMTTKLATYGGNGMSGHFWRGHSPRCWRRLVARRFWARRSRWRSRRRCRRCGGCSFRLAWG